MSDWIDSIVVASREHGTGEIQELSWALRDEVNRRMDEWRAAHTEIDESFKEQVKRRWPWFAKRWGI
jgi:hypothetical protein